MAKINFWKLIISIIICQLTGIIGSLFTVSAISSWYLGINKPAFNPPSWVFAPVWFILYLLMGISFYIIWNKGLNSNKSKTAAAFFILQLVLNSIWSILFFWLKSPLFAFIEIIFLWFAIIITTICSFRISKKAAYLLIPYLLWVSFAAILNFSIYILN